MKYLLISLSVAKAGGNPGPELERLFKESIHQCDRYFHKLRKKYYLYQIPSGSNFFTEFSDSDRNSPPRSAEAERYLLYISGAIEEADECLSKLTSGKISTPSLSERIYSGLV